MSSDKTHYVVYAGDAVVHIPGVGVFQRGTAAWVDAAAADFARRQGEFQIYDAEGRVEQATPPARPEPVAPAPAPPPVQHVLPAHAPEAIAELPKHAAPEPAPAEAAPPEPAPAEAAPPQQKRPRRGRASAMISAVQVDEEPAPAPAGETEPKK